MSDIKVGIVPQLLPEHCTYVYDDGTECTNPCAPLKVIVCGSVSLYCSEHSHTDDCECDECNDPDEDY